jgi:hypothetical protein
MIKQPVTWDHEALDFFLAKKLRVRDLSRFLMLLLLSAVSILLGRPIRSMLFSSSLYLSLCILSIELDQRL